MKANEFNIACVIVTYNRKDLLLECLNAVTGQSHLIGKIIIIDNASTDGTEEAVHSNSQYDMSKMIYKRLEKNIGGAGGFWEGMNIAQQMDFDWVWIMDDDTIPTDTALEKLIDAVEFLKMNNEKFSFLASAVYGPKGEFINVPTISNRLSENGYGCWYKYLINGIVEIKIATFVSLLISMNSVKKCGLPIKEYFIWGDDSEYTMRLTRFSGPAFFIGNSVVCHKRESGKALSFICENNLNRIDLYKYYIRNNLLNVKYYNSNRSFRKEARKYIKQSIKILLNRRIRHRSKKIYICLSGVISAVLIGDRLNMTKSCKKSSI